MTIYQVTIVLDVEGPDWPEDTSVPKHLWDWPEGLVEQIEDSAIALLASGQTDEPIQQIEVVFE